MGVRYIFGQDGAFRTEPVIVSKNITQNGTYDPATDGADGYAPVTVNVEGGGSSWQTVFEGSVTTTDQGGDFSGEISGLTSLTADTIKVTFNGVEYELPKTQNGYGAETKLGIDFSEYPLYIEATSTPYMLYTESAGTYTLKIEEPQSGGSSDFSTAEVTVVNNTGELINGSFVCVRDTPISSVVPLNTLPFDSSTNFTVPLYKGNCAWKLNSGTLNVSVSGDIEWNLGSKMALITGDCTITIS